MEQVNVWWNPNGVLIPKHSTSLTLPPKTPIIHFGGVGAI